VLIGTIYGAVMSIKTKFKCRLKNEAGFTLVELMLATLLAVVVVSMVSMTLINSSNTAKDIISIATSEIDARTAIYRTSKDIRELNNIELADKDNIKFTSNVDSDEDYETVTYYLLSNESGYYDLYRKVDSDPEKIIISNIISNDFFSYYTDLSGNSLITPVTESELRNIKIVKINIAVDQGKSGYSNRTFRLETQITLRNKL